MLLLSCSLVGSLFLLSCSLVGSLFLLSRSLVGSQLVLPHFFECVVHFFIYRSLFGLYIIQDLVNNLSLASSLLGLHIVLRCTNLHTSLVGRLLGLHIVLRYINLHTSLVGRLLGLHGIQGCVLLHSLLSLHSYAKNYYRLKNHRRFQFEIMTSYKNT